MKTRLLHSALGCLLIAIWGSAHAQSTTFTYQGRLNDGSAAANGSYDLVFSVWTAASGPAQVDSTLTNTATPVSNGLFTVTLDFGNQFPGADRWLEMGVRSNGGGAFIILNPRQKITPAPYAITASNLSGALPAGQLSGAVPSGNLSGTYGSTLTLNNAANQLSGVFTGNGAGVSNVNAALLGGLGASNFWQRAGNVGTTAGTHFLGTTDNQPLELKVNSARALRMEPNATSPNLVGGYVSNFVSAGVVGAVIAGGGQANLSNRVTGSFSTVGGGYNNLANFGSATVAGGDNNLANQDRATVSGGYSNRATGLLSTVSGGDINLASGQAATVPGGSLNDATASYAFAAGRRAKATNQGSFVWADSQNTDFSSRSNNQFLIRASGNVGVNTNNPQSALHVNGTVTATAFSGNLSPADFSGGLVASALNFSNVGNIFVGNGSGLLNLNPAAILWGSCPPWSVCGNAGTTAGLNFLGTTDNQPLEFKVNGQRAFRLEPNTGGTPNVIGGSSINYITAGDGSAIGGGFSNAIVYVMYGTVSGGSRNVIALEPGPENVGATIGGGLENKIGASSGSYGGGSTIGGGRQNTLYGDSPGSTIAGGWTNFIWGGSGTIGGGKENYLDGGRLTISGGHGNSIQASSSSSIGGGESNRIYLASFATIGGGELNEILGRTATIAGGSRNTNSGDYAVIPGGSSNVASGPYSFAAGRQAKANHSGAVVWADSTGVDFASTADDQFLIRAAGGVGIGTSTPGTSLQVNGGIRARGGSPGGFGANNNGYAFAGNGGDDDSGMFSSADGQLEFYGNNNEYVRILANGNVGIGLVNPANKLHVAGGVSATAFVTTSDRNAKENFTRVSPAEVLSQVASLPITRWTFKEMKDGAHIGPTAQDFHAAFGLGTDDKHIATVDADGVALAAIQGLNEKVEFRSQELAAENAELRRRNEALEKRLQKLETLLEPRLSSGR